MAHFFTIELYLPTGKVELGQDEDVGSQAFGSETQSVRAASEIENTNFGFGPIREERGGKGGWKLGGNGQVVKNADRQLAGKRKRWS